MSRSPNSRSFVALLLSLLLLFMILVFPAHPAHFTIDAVLRLPLELPFIVLCLLVMTRHPGLLNALMCLFVALLILLLTLRLADLGSYLAFNRRFSPLLEWHLLADGWNLASTSIGPLQASVVVALMLGTLCLLAIMLHRALRTIAYSRGRSRAWLHKLAIVCLVAGPILWLVLERNQLSSAIDARVAPELQQRIAHVLTSIEDQHAFIRELQQDSVLDRTTPTFGALNGRDVILIFVESYGRSYIEAERFAPLARLRLTQTEATLQAAGLQARSGWLTSPIRGGRSWLAHATLQSGLDIDNQARFDRLISTDRRSLSRLFADAGWHTAGVKPAIEFAWPEGSWYGFDSLYVSDDLGYAGDRFGYVTMPDQYTLSRFEHDIRRASEQPVMAMIALLSTHAPWTPLPRKIDWDLVGDGSIYDGRFRFGEPISWKYRNRVQEMYARSFDYTLDIIGDYAARYANDGVIIVVGDHQPAPIIDGWGRTGDVPVHVISRDASLLQRLPETLWSKGMIPAINLNSQPMKSLRQTLATRFEEPATTDCDGAGDQFVSLFPCFSTSPPRRSGD